MRKGDVTKMSALLEASQLVRSLASPPMVGDTVKRQIARAARRIPFWSTSRVKSVWYRDERYRISADEIAQLRDIADMQQKDAGHEELQKLRARVARLETLLRISDPQFNSDQINALCRSDRGVNSALD
ncbi:MAG: hypothetical protein KGZ68_00990 [Dechloromonas sp.]|nr:hypothetical protein [Dechloromonas sp.]